VVNEKDEIAYRRVKVGILTHGRRVIEEGLKRDSRFIVLEVRKSNRAARAFYSKNGFYPVTVRLRYYRDNGEDAIVMVKPLKESGRIPPAKGID